MVDDELAEDLKHALEAGSFELATSLAQEYGARVAAHMRVAKTEDERAVIIRDASSFLQDRLNLARVMRAHISAQIDNAVRLASYGGGFASQNTWQMEG